VEHALRVQRVSLATRWRTGAAVAAWSAVCLSIATGGTATHAQASAQPPAPVVVVAEYDGVIHPITAEFVEDVIARADRTGAVAIVLILRTPGGLLDSTRTIVSRIVASRAPVVVFIAPPGSRAASAGFLITLAADVAVMAPGTHIGAAHPVTPGGETPGGEVMSQKMAADAAAYARTIAEARRRNAALAAEAVTESRAFTDGEALHADPPLVDFTARDVDDLLRQLDGRPITRFDGRTVNIATAGARLERVEMTWRQSLLGAIAHPQIAYLLLTLGMLGLVVEMWNPGVVLPGVAGGVCLLLAFFAFQVLPVNVTGLLLIVFGMALLGAELMVPSFGVLGIGGAVALLAGSLMVTRDVPGIRVGYNVILPVVIALVVIVLGLGRLALQAQRQPSAAGTDALIGAEGRALTALTPMQPGQISVHGEIWHAVSDRPIPAGRRLRVRAAAGLTLRVEPEDIDTPDMPGGTS
jgi:membrane-bound serine protease (ClpP class)